MKPQVGTKYTVSSTNWFEDVKYAEITTYSLMDHEWNGYIYMKDGTRISCTWDENGVSAIGSYDLVNEFNEKDNKYYYEGDGECRCPWDEVTDPNNPRHRVDCPYIRKKYRNQRRVEDEFKDFIQRTLSSFGF